MLCIFTYTHLFVLYAESVTISTIKRYIEWQIITSVRRGFERINHLSQHRPGKKFEEEQRREDLEGSMDRVHFEVNKSHITHSSRNSNDVPVKGIHEKKKGYLVNYQRRYYDKSKAEHAQVSCAHREMKWKKNGKKYL